MRNTLRRLAIGGLLGTVLALGTAIMPALPAYAQCDGTGVDPCVTATSVTSNHIGIYWQTGYNYDYFNVRCCRGVLADEQVRINSGGSDGYWGVDAQPGMEYVFKVEGCYGDGWGGTRSCSGWGELRVGGPATSDLGMTKDKEKTGRTSSALSPAAPSLDFGPDTCPQGLVWRESFAGDHVCVTPQQRAQAKGKGNQQDIH